MCAVLVTAMLLACGGGDGGSDRPAAKQAKTTMLVYLVASDLIPSAEGDLYNMLYAANSPDVNVILQVGGGSEPGDVRGVDLTKTVRYRLTAIAASPGATIVQGWALERLPESEQPGTTVAMNKPDTLRDFIRWGARQYPAEQYALTLWNHGGGPIAGFGWDKAHGGGTSLSLGDIASAMKQAQVHFELVGFDACLMSSLEVATALQPYANYLVASEEVTTGWDWTKVVQFMVDQPLAKGDALGKAIVQTYKEDHEDLDFTAYAVTDLRQVPALIATLEKAAGNLQQALQSGGLSAWTQIAASRRNAEDFQTNIFDRSSDLVDVLSLVKQLSSRNLLAPALVQEIHTAFNRAVIFKDGGEDEAYGLMMYFPRFSTLDTALLGNYAKLDFSSPIKDLVQSYAQFAASGQMPQITISTPVLSGNTLSATVTSSVSATGSVFDRGYAVLTQAGKGLAIQQLSVSGNDLRLPSADQWPHLNGALITMLPEDEEDSIFLIPVYIPDGYGTGSKGMLYAIADDNGRLVVKYKVTSGELAGAGLAMLEVEEDDEFRPLIMNAQGQLTVSGTKLRAPEGVWAVEMRQVRGVGYQVFAAASDLVGNFKVSSTGVNLPASN